jgi:hypothetical protein
LNWRLGKLPLGRKLRFSVTVLSCRWIEGRKHFPVYLVGSRREVDSLLGLLPYTLRLLFLHRRCFLLCFFNLLWAVDPVVVRVELKLCVQGALQQLGVDTWQQLVASFSVWEVMLSHNLFRRSPLVKGLLADLFDAVLAQVLNFGLVGVAHVTEIFEVDVDDQVFGYYFVFVLSNVLRAQLHLSCLDVVPSLDEGRVKHYAEDDFVGETCVLEEDLDVSLEGHALLLLLSEQKYHPLFLLAVLSLRRVGELLANV